MSNKHWEQNKDATIYVGNLDERFGEALMWELMTQMGPVINVHMPMDRVSRTHQGYGFVEFDTADSADYAARCLNGIRVFGKPVRVNKASADKQKNTEIGAELFVNNLDGQVDEKVLYDTFSQFGVLVAPPNVIRDQNNISKGYGFVSFDSFEASDIARDTMSGQYLLSKQITVEYAYKKDGKGERHGDEAERKLAAEGKKHNIVPEQQPLPSAYLMTGPAATSAPAAPGYEPTPPQHQQQQPPPSAAPPAMPAGFGGPPGGGRGPPPPVFNGIPPPMAAAGRGSALPPAPSGLPARPPPSQGGFNGPPDFSAPGGFRAAPPPGMGAAIPPPGFGGPPPPPGFSGANGVPLGQPGGFMPPPGFPPGQVPPPAGFGRR